MKAGFCQTIAIEADDPAFEGHFPAHALLPGAAILARILAILAERWQLEPPVQLPRVKFMGQIFPGSVMTLKAELDLVGEQAKVAFTLLQGEKPLLQGAARYGSPA
ncbi:hypothetical protein SAMN07250955_105186 [Arboricoccus pini]|uniref:ApeI dehydratase-like domain-containing protein n=1 Tax=Arboricoccus pini TaxID=1963835 RepID=A0A212R4A9_9PROT|nr:hypothetical protein [Arboricoccus pini]SNB66763.1 hypothetical protein SAMN07250955_105186 [Arboricoccus pini]